jgi:hypothetical protein
MINSVVKVVNEKGAAPSTRPPACRFLSRAEIEIHHGDTEGTERGHREFQNLKFQISNLRATFVFSVSPW